MYSCSSQLAAITGGVVPLALIAYHLRTRLRYSFIPICTTSLKHIPSCRKPSKAVSCCSLFIRGRIRYGGTDDVAKSLSTRSLNMAGGDAPADENKVQQELQTLEQELPAEEASSESGKLKQLMVRVIASLASPPLSFVTEGPAPPRDQSLTVSVHFRLY